MSKLKELREVRGFTQEALARAADLSLKQIQNIERGGAQPRITTARRLAAALGVSLDELWQEATA